MGPGRELHGAELQRAKLFAETNAAKAAGTVGDEEYGRRLAAIGEATDGQLKGGLALPTPPTDGVATPAVAPSAPMIDLASRQVPAAPVVIATFNETCGWCGRAITLGDEGFVLEGHGPIEPAAVLGYDAQGYLDWVDEEQRAMVGRLALEGPHDAAVGR